MRVVATRYKLHRRPEVFPVESPQYVITSAGLDRKMIIRFSLQVVEYVDKVAKSNKSSFHQAAQQIFTAKVSGTFSRSVLSTV